MAQSFKTDKDDKLLLSRAEDAIRYSERNYCVKTMGFLTPRERTLIGKNILPPPDVKISFTGGYDDAERVMLVCSPEFLDADDNEVLSVIKITGRDLAALTHRDYLGSIMGLGITRENIGDILVSDFGAFVFVKAEIAEYIMSNLEKIGRRGIKTELCSCSEADIPEPKFKEVSTTVSSLRLDACAAAAFGISRAKAAELIGQELISVNFEIISSVSAQVAEGDLISARGFGRTRLARVGGTTRKGRISITLLRYE